MFFEWFFRENVNNLSLEACESGFFFYAIIYT